MKDNVFPHIATSYYVLLYVFCNYIFIFVLEIKKINFYYFWKNFQI